MLFINIRITPNDEPYFLIIAKTKDFERLPLEDI